MTSPLSNPTHDGGLNFVSIPLRKGKWTSEEENYASRIILLFNKGMLRIANGTTLRSYLSERLNW